MTETEKETGGHDPGQCDRVRTRSVPDMMALRLRLVLLTKKRLGQLFRMQAMRGQTDRNYES